MPDDPDDLIDAMIPTAAALAVAVTDTDPDAVAALLTPLDTRRLHALAITLAAHIDIDKPLQPTVAAIADRVTRRACLTYGLAPGDLTGTTRLHAAAHARTVAMAACRLEGMTLMAVGAAFNRDHSTVLYAARRVAADPGLLAEAEALMVADTLGAAS